MAEAHNLLDLPKTKAVILVGGASKGTRFRPLSLDLPKPLFPLGGKPMIEHHIEACARVPGIMEVILLGFYEESLFTSFLESVSERFGIPMRYLREAKSLGTAGGLSRYGNAILSGNPKAVFVLHCDVGCSFPLINLLRFHIQKSQECTILGKVVEPEEARKYGCMVKDPNTFELLHYAEKPSSIVSELINCGVYVISPWILDYIGQIRTKGSQSPNRVSYYMDRENDIIRLEQEVIMPLAGKGKIFVYEMEGFWAQVKEPKAALHCSELYLAYYKEHKPELLTTSTTSLRARMDGLLFMRNQKPTVGLQETRLNIVGAVYIHPSAKVESSAKIGPNVTIAAGVEIAAGARLMNCIILEDVSVKEHAFISHSIIGWGSVVGAWTRVQGTPDNPTIFGAGVVTEAEIVVRNCTVLPHKALNESCHQQIIL
ncbi:mannose-1-phosphate guanylyltransferase [Galdieria sulphuraria]|uniref:Mannose-1-phosphate guanylyltransferase n=1 Tax=Galdieria sulphuraria TaxID=130081 RepID=M2XK56_GALSU|nr:mannose-1-phosphate guanylyltransferase [Galdieria sulphuraria]EME30517.1 mannose-1-phosphate guanylyltransferase [Galdieria sulphuraria]|eukprot:XP_005707037.1 mannose-1-phosphate guanylyltransferase [Galdieria sulphuraria]